MFLYPNWAKMSSKYSLWTFSALHKLHARLLEILTSNWYLSCKEKKKSSKHNSGVSGTNCVNINLTKLRANCLSCSSLSSHGEHNMAFVRGASSFWLKETVSTVWESLFMGRCPDESNEAFLLTTHLLKIPGNRKY